MCPNKKGLWCCMQAYKSQACRDAGKGGPCLLVQLAHDGQRCMTHPTSARKMRSACSWQRDALRCLHRVMSQKCVEVQGQAGWHAAHAYHVHAVYADWESYSAMQLQRYLLK